MIRKIDKQPQMSILERGPNGEAKVMQDNEGILRYKYTSGECDMTSTVDMRNPFIEVAGALVVAAETQMDGSDQAHPAEVPHAA